MAASSLQNSGYSQGSDLCWTRMPCSSSVSPVSFPKTQRHQRVFAWNNLIRVISLGSICNLSQLAALPEDNTHSSAVVVSKSPIGESAALFGDSSYAPERNPVFTRLVVVDKDKARVSIRQGCFLVPFKFRRGWQFTVSINSYYNGVHLTIIVIFLV